MSGLSPTTATTYIRKKPPKESPVGSDLCHLDQRLKRLKDDVLSYHPYILTVPTDSPLEVPNQAANTWAVGRKGPFSKEEQQLQYLTFQPHSKGNSLARAVGGWSDEKGNIEMDEPGPRASGTTTSNGSVKKKISLSDYKERRKSITPPDQAAAAAVANSSALNKTDGRLDSKLRNPMNGHSREQRDTLASQVPSHTAPTNGSLKRPSESEREHLKPSEGKDADMSTKKRRISTEEGINRDSTHSKAERLPDLLSPTLPATSSSPKLPRLLSPTLPPDIEEELSKLPEDSPALESSGAKNLAKPGQSKDHVSKAESAMRDSQHSDRGLTSSNQSERDQPLRSSRPGRSDILPLQKTRTGHEEPRLIVKLKYGKSNKKLVEGLLKFSGKKNAPRLTSPAKDQDGRQLPQSKESDKKQSRTPLPDHTARSSERSEKKSNHEASKGMSSAPMDRSKELKASAEKPHTPVSTSQPSTATHHEKAKPAQTTPVRYSQGPTPRGIQSTDGNENTPSQSSKDHGSSAQLPSPQLSGQKAKSPTHDRRAWKDEFTRLGGLGRELKHASDRHTSKENATSADEKLGAATAIEAILCFILAFVADDQSKALARQTGDSSNWMSIIAYWRVVKMKSAPYPQLRKLCLILGAVSYDAIHALDLERLAATSLPHEHATTPTPGSDGDAAKPDDNKKTMKDFLELKNRLPECYKESQRLWLEGIRGLSADVVSSEFPKTWSERSRHYSDRGKQQLKAGDYSGDIFLPFDRATSPVEAVRFAWSLLGEWCDKEKVAWKGRLSL